MGFVSLGVESTCDVTCFGTVNIKMFDGVVRNLGGVVYTLKM